MAGSARIRPAVVADYEALCALWEILDEYHRLALPTLFRRPSGARRELSQVQSLIDGPDSTIVVVEGDNGELLGFATIFVRTQPAMPVRAERRYAEVDNMVVKPPARRNGLGRALIEASSDWAAQRDLATLELAVHEFNDGARAFYQSLGFSTVVRRMARPRSRPLP